jgi:hypothetical protein
MVGFATLIVVRVATYDSPDPEVLERCPRRPSPNWSVAPGQKGETMEDACEELAIGLWRRQ